MDYWYVLSEDGVEVHKASTEVEIAQIYRLFHYLTVVQKFTTHEHNERSKFMLALKLHRTTLRVVYKW